MVSTIFLLLCFTSKAFSTTISGQTIGRFQGAEWGNETEGLIEVDKYFGSLLQGPEAKLTAEGAGSKATIKCEVKQLGAAEAAFKSHAEFHCDPNASAIFGKESHVSVTPGGHLSVGYGSELQANGGIEISNGDLTIKDGTVTLHPWAKLKIDGGGGLTLVHGASVSVSSGALLELQYTLLTNYGNISLDNDAVFHVRVKGSRDLSNYGTIQLAPKALFIVKVYYGFSTLITPDAFSKIQLGQSARLQMDGGGGDRSNFRLSESARVLLSDSADMDIYQDSKVTVNFNSELALGSNSQLKMRGGTLTVGDLSRFETGDSASVLMAPGTFMSVQGHAELKIKPNVWVLMEVKSGFSVLANSTCEIGQFLFLEPNRQFELSYEADNPNGIVCLQL